LEHLADDRIFAAKRNSFVRFSFTVDGAHGARAQVQAHVERHNHVANAHCAGEITKRVFVARFARRAFCMIVMPVHDIQSPGRVVFLAERVVEVEVDFLSLTTFLSVFDSPVNLGFE
jgi:hypothetical protein